jgi:hypothetical protein
LQFWQSIDQDASGEVDFEEFFVWYRKYFLTNGGMASTPAEVFYSSLMSVRLPRLTQQYDLTPHVSFEYEDNGYGRGSVVKGDKVSKKNHIIGRRMTVS